MSAGQRRSVSLNVRHSKGFRRSVFELAACATYGSGGVERVLEDKDPETRRGKL